MKKPDSMQLKPRRGRGNGCDETKVFCIGFHKTGTTSLTVALRQLGYTVTGRQRFKGITKRADLWPTAVRVSRHFRAFQDNPWPLYYQQLDELYPRSKFILTLRDSSAWIISQVKHFGTSETRMRRWIYGVGYPQGHESLYLERYERHNNEVINYFKGRPQDLLMMNLSEGAGWAELCPFLGCPIPDQAFPHANQARDRSRPASPSAQAES